MSFFPDHLPDWPRYCGPVSAKGDIRCQLEDFQVVEQCKVQPSGEGNHQWLWVEKTAANTEWVARQLARRAGCRNSDVGYAGLKDRHAVTRQWFSLPLSSEPPDWQQIDIEGIVVMQVHAHQKKLQRGALLGNTFTLVIRNIHGDVEDLEKRLQAVADTGVPNYFGSQRFGREAGNLAKAEQWLISEGRPRRLPRHLKSLYLSTARSFIFNRLLAHRVEQGNWNQLVEGDTAMLAGSHSIFEVDTVDDEITRRCEEGDIHPSGLLPGRGQVSDSEQHILADYQPVIEALGTQGVDSSRRAFRVIPDNLSWNLVEESDNTHLELSFGLPSGCFATSVLRELLDVEDASVARHKEQPTDSV